MIEEQELIVLVFCWSCLLIIAVVCLVYLFQLFSYFRSYFASTYEPQGEDQHIDFSTVPAIDTYIPQIGSPYFNHPLLACVSEGIDENLFNWSDPDKPRSYYDLSKDAEDFMKEKGGLKNKERHIFAVVKHWPPPASVKVERGNI